MCSFQIVSIETVEDLPKKYRDYKVANENNRGELARMEGGDTIVVVYDTKNGHRAYLYDHIQFNENYFNAMNDDNIVIVYQVLQYPSRG